MPEDNQEWAPPYCVNVTPISWLLDSQVCHLNSMDQIVPRRWGYHGGKFEGHWAGSKSISRSQNREVGIFTNDFWILDAHYICQLLIFATCMPAVLPSKFGDFLGNLSSGSNLSQHFLSPLSAFWWKSPILDCMWGHPGGRIQWASTTIHGSMPSSVLELTSFALNYFYLFYYNKKQIHEFNGFQNRQQR